MLAQRTPTDTLLRVGIILLTLATAFVHLSLNFPDAIFILNGMGYLTLLAALYLPIPQLMPYHRAIRWIFIGYATLTIVIWIAIGERTPLGYANKLNELALIALLLLEARRAGLR